HSFPTRRSSDLFPSPVYNHPMYPVPSQKSGRVSIRQLLTSVSYVNSYSFVFISIALLYGQSYFSLQTFYWSNFSDLFCMPTTFDNIIEGDSQKCNNYPRPGKLRFIDHQ